MSGTMVVNAKNGAPSQYSNFSFHSFCMFNGRSIGAGPDGIFILEEEDKDIWAVDDERNISAWLEFPVSQLGKPSRKGLRRIYYGGEHSGKIKFTTTLKRVTDLQYEYTMNPRNKDNLQQVGYFSCRAKPTAEYWSFRVDNVYGSDFSLDWIEGEFILSNRRRGI